MISESFLQQLRDRNDIEDAVSRYVTLKKAGKNTTGLCPFHSEKTPSFTVFPDTQSFHCFGCGAGGDVITFTKKIENLDYIDAVKFLADRAGLVMPEDGFSQSTHNLRNRVFEINKIAANHFFENLKKPEAKAAIDYIAYRKLTTETVRKFGVGFAMDEWDNLLKLLKQKGYSLEEMVLSGLVVKNEKGSFYDRFRNKIMFPIIDLSGKVIGFGGRVLDNSKPKYINSPETIIFKKGTNLFAMNLAKNNIKESAILAEGYMDVIAMHQAGIGTAVATLGTAITAQQARLLSRYCKEVIIGYDSDEAGKNATNKAIKILGEVDLQIKVLNISEGKDPDEYIKTFGVEKFKALLKASGNYILHRVNSVREKLDLNKPDGAIAFLKQASVILSEIRSPVEREVYINTIAKESNISKEKFETEVNRLVKSFFKKSIAKSIREKTDISLSIRDKINPQRGDNLRVAKAEERLIGILFAHHNFLDEILRKMDYADFLTDFNRELFKIIAEKIKNGENVEMINLSGILTEHQMNKLSEIIAGNSILGNGNMAEAIELINIIKTQKEIADLKDIGSMTDDEFLRSIERLKKG